MMGDGDARSIVALAPFAFIAIAGGCWDSRVDDTDAGPETAGRCLQSYCEQVFVPAGPFVMGSEDPYDIIVPEWESYPFCSSLEMPEHVVHLSAFWIDRYEVTVERYMACVAAGACRTPPYPEAIEPRYLHHPIGATYPDAVAYCGWIGRRLPTEAEWEKAARGGCEIGGDPSRCDDPEDERQWPWGDEIPDCTRANIFVGPPDSPENLSCAAGRVPDTMPVGSYPAGRGPYGVDDMAGNVGEWVSDWFGLYDEFGCASECTDPTGPPTGVVRTLRGCSFWCALADRGLFQWSRVSGRRRSEHWSDDDAADRGIGIRCASDGE